MIYTSETSYVELEASRISGYWRHKSVDCVVPGVVEIVFWYEITSCRQGKDGRKKANSH
jgi:hypothetical protein